MTRPEVIETVRTMLAADLACDPDALGAEGIVFSPYQALHGRRRYKPSANPLLIVTMGDSVVVSAKPERLEWLREQLGAMQRDEVFSAKTVASLVKHCAEYRQNLYGPDLKHTCSSRDLRSPLRSSTATIRLLEGDDVLALYEHPGFDNALQYDAHHPLPDVLATVAMVADEIVGIAGASADSDALWQIGIDVLPAVRGRGVGRALVTELTAAIHARGRVPYYSTDPSNIRSRALAGSVGFWPVWTELRVTDWP